MSWKCHHCQSLSGGPGSVKSALSLLRDWTTDRHGFDYHKKCLEKARASARGGQCGFSGDMCASNVFATVRPCECLPCREYVYYWAVEHDKVPDRPMATQVEGQDTK